ncbi:MAG: type III-A CRISPR-associated RAMP protein Csm5 [Methanosarcinales archaeon]
MKCELQTLSPTHIGNGKVLNPIEYVVDDMFYCIDMDKLFQDKDFNSKLFTNNISRGKKIILGEFAKNVAKRNLKYKLSISDSTKKNLLEVIRTRSAEVKEQIKTINKHYIPGSSIKGALRTAYMYWKLKNDPRLMNKGIKDLIIAMKKKRVDIRFVDEVIERRVFGSDPTRDIFKTLQISDSEPYDASSMEIDEVRTLTTTKQRGHTWKRFKTFVEAVKKNQKTYLNINCTKNLISDISEATYEFSDALIKYELNFYNNYNTNYYLDDIIDFYEDLQSINTKNCNNLLHIAWGAGWHSMTIGLLLKNKNIFFDIRKKFRLGKTFIPEFPKTRKLIFEKEYPVYPLGWMQLKF